MKKFFSTGVSSQASYDLATLLLRLGLGAIIVFSHGWEKISNYSEMQGNFVNFLGLGTSISLTLSLFAEFY